MSGSLTRIDLIVGSLHCAVHASQLVKDAAALYRSGRASSSFLLTVSAREELGKHYILSKRAELLGHNATITVADVQSEIRPARFPHQVKLAAGQSTFALSAPLPRETFARRQTRYAEMRTLDARALHQQRMTAQYVDLSDDGVWSLPANLQTGAAHDLLMTVAYEVADPLRWVVDDGEVRDIASSLTSPLPSAEEFLREVESALHQSAGP